MYVTEQIYGYVSACQKNISQTVCFVKINNNFFFFNSLKGMITCSKYSHSTESKQYYHFM